MDTPAEIQEAIGRLSRYDQFELASWMAKSVGLRLYTDDGFDWEDTQRKLSQAAQSKCRSWTDEDWAKLGVKL